MQTIDDGVPTVIVERGDSFTAVPRSFRSIITKEIEAVYNDPQSHFRSLAARSPFKNLQTWLRTVTEGGRWDLRLHRRNRTSTWAGFRWECETACSAEIGLPDEKDLDHYPKSLRQFYSLVGFVELGNANSGIGLQGPGQHLRLDCMDFDYHGADVDPAAAHQLGSDGSEGILFYTDDGRGGWVSMETHEIHLLGNLTKTIEWYFGEMLSGRIPEWSYDWT
ncbi:MAG: hypothetical protein K1X57_11725 [Gemmataceae bacterium]|nr:hypothetical protein [Gemmataceae bacterium]